MKYRIVVQIDVAAGHFDDATLELWVYGLLKENGRDKLQVYDVQATEVHEFAPALRKSDEVGVGEPLCTKCGAVLDYYWRCPNHCDA